MPHVPPHESPSGLGRSEAGEAPGRSTVETQARAAKAAAPEVACLPATRKNTVLLAAADRLRAEEERILAANARDVANGRAAGLGEAMIDRLSLDSSRIGGIAAGLEQVAALPDPVGEVVRGHVLSNGIHARQVRVPLGVVGIIYEARPNVTVDACGLTFKAGNVAVLRGSRSAATTNATLVGLIQDVLAEHGLPREVAQLLPSESHDSVRDLITARGLVDVVIPRGSARLINSVVENATVPAIETGTGNCHFFVHASADLGQAIAMLLNGKTRRVSVCNATETALLDSALSDADKLRVVRALQDAGVTVHGNVEELAAFGAADVAPADERDWAEEYLSMDIAVKVVDGVDGAIEHIARYSTHHTDAIACADYGAAQAFRQRVDSAAVMVNASTAFTDGEVFGFGAEIGISTQKLHARGPMALPELTTTKWVLEGAGQVRP